MSVGRYYRYLVAVGPHGEGSGDGDEGEFLGGGRVHAGDAAAGQRVVQAGRDAGGLAHLVPGGGVGGGSGGCIGASVPRFGI
jgi:hypothetical protein